MESHVSVIVPAYNAERFISRALSSIERQSRQPDEVIVIDDGSTDDTFHEIKNFELSSQLNLVSVRQQNGGSSAARNHALRLANGNLIAFMDADDVMYPRFIERMVSGLENHPDWVVCFSDRDIIDKCERLLGKDLDHPKFINISKRDAGMGFMEIIDDAFFSKMLEGSVIPMTMVCRRSELNAVNGFDESLIFNEDRLLFLEIIKRGGRFGYAAESLGTWQRHDDNKSGSANAYLNIQASDLILQKLLDNKLRLNLSTKELSDINSERILLSAKWMYAASHERPTTALSLGLRLISERRITFTCFLKSIIRSVYVFIFKHFRKND